VAGTGVGALESTATTESVEKPETVLASAWMPLKLEWVLVSASADWEAMSGAGVPEVQVLRSPQAD
jgi:hypothetical protein